MHRFCSCLDHVIERRDAWAWESHSRSDPFLTEKAGSLFGRAAGRFLFARVSQVFVVARVSSRALHFPQSLERFPFIHPLAREAPQSVTSSVRPLANPLRLARPAGAPTRDWQLSF